MIRSKADYLDYLKQDRIALGYPESLSFKQRFKQFVWPNKTYQFEKVLRSYEYYLNCKTHTLLGKLGLFVAKCRHRRLSHLLGFSIGPNVFGPGLSIPHYGNIVINPNVRIGRNCRIHVGVNIGAHKDKAPIIGDNVYIGPGAILFGDIRIADNVTIGANATVNKSILQENVAIAGTPARIIKENYSSWIENK